MDVWIMRYSGCAPDQYWGFQAHNESAKWNETNFFTVNTEEEVIRPAQQLCGSNFIGTVSQYYPSSLGLHTDFNNGIAPLSLHSAEGFHAYLQS